MGRGSADVAVGDRPVESYLHKSIALTRISERRKIRAKPGIVRRWFTPQLPLARGVLLKVGVWRTLPMSGAQRELDLRRSDDKPRFRKYGVDRPETDPTRLWSGLRDLSVRLVEVIERSAPTAPILVAGDWGSGKSSLLEAARQSLRDSHHPTIWFDAWSREGEGTLLPLLLRALGQYAPRKVARKGRVQWGWIRFMKEAHRAVAENVPSVAVLAGAVGLSPFNPWFHILHLFEPLVHGLGRRHIASDADAIAVLQRELHRFVEEIVSRKMGRPVVFFIDNLDRCNPEVALSLIESLRILIGSGEAVPDARYVVALDRTALIRAITLKFHGMSEYDGNRYLEKIFPISFHLPRPEGAAILQFVQSFLSPGDRRRGEEHSPSTNDDILSRALADPIFANPRLMKRCIERFSMVLEFEYKTVRKGGPVPSDQQDYTNLFLAKWIAAGERWPDLRRLFSRHGDDYWVKVGNHLANQQAPLPDKEAVELLAEQDLLYWLRRELFGNKETRLDAYRYADLRLRSFGL